MNGEKQAAREFDDAVQKLRTARARKRKHKALNTARDPRACKIDASKRVSHKDSTRRVSRGL